VQSSVAQTFPLLGAIGSANTPSGSQDIFDVTGPLSDHDMQRYKKALQKRIDAESARLHAKDRDSIAAAIESVAAADRELEIVKRDLNKKSAEQPTQQPDNNNAWPVNNTPVSNRAPSTVQATTTINSPYSAPPLVALPGETLQPPLPRSQAEFAQMESERLGQLVHIAQQNGSPQTQWPTSSATAPALPKPTPEELEILRDRVKTIDDEYRLTEKRYKTGKGSSNLDVARVATDLAEAQSDLALAEGKFYEAISRLKEAREHAETAVTICTDADRAGVGSDNFESIVKTSRKLSDIKLKLVRLQNPPYVAPKAPAGASPYSAPSSPTSYQNDPYSLPAQAATGASTQPAIPSIGTATSPSANRPSQIPVTNWPARQLADPLAHSRMDANAPSASSPVANLPTESAAAPQQILGEPANAALSAPRETSLLVNENPAAIKPSPSPSEKPVLRYDGKPFSVWSSVFQTELSTEKRLEAVKALAAFARAGYQSEATDVILETVPQYDFGDINNNIPEGHLKTALIQLLTRVIPAQYWLKPLRERYDANPTSWSTFADAVVPEASYSFDSVTRESGQKFLLKLAEGENGSAAALNRLVNSDPKLMNPEIKALILKDLKGNQAQLAIAIRSLSSAEAAPPELTEILLHGDESKQITARVMLEQLSGGSLCSAVANSMNEILKDKTRQKDRLAAIRALAALGSSVQDPGIEKSLREVASSGSDAEKIAVACAFERITNGSSQAGNMIQSLMNIDAKNASDISAVVETEKRTILGRKW
jgi:hypothetical protein